ncbi:glycosyltransferase [Tabrizicola caldifontis]|uniref:glycosyltransferase n=1 Tax=Tabrizicola caldifontis TaxID=2528036 RepID=UPI001081146E|nr:glycosyltransferase [Rhodobacter sp. YIM 73028]
MQMKTFGHCRFSFFGQSDTGRAIANLDAARELLWNDQRMAVRFHLFENITLPSILNQTDPDFTFVIISSEQMPTVHRDRLEALVAGHANIRILWTAKTDISKASRPILLEASNDGRDPALHFRLDDDDAVSVDFVQHLKQAAASLEPTSVISFPYGVMGYLDNGMARHRELRKDAIAIGYGIVKAPDDFRSPFMIQHRKYAKLHPGVTDASFAAYHYTRHSTNNTNGYGAVIDVAPNFYPA